MLPTGKIKPHKECASRGIKAQRGELFERKVGSTAYMKKEKAKIVFVCVENACRSQMAQGFAEVFGGERVEVFSAGSRPSAPARQCPCSSAL